MSALLQKLLIDMTYWLLDIMPPIKVFTDIISTAAFYVIQICFMYMFMRALDKEYFEFY